MSTVRRPLGLAVLFAAVLLSVSVAHAEDWHAALARHWAPLIYQDVAVDLVSNPEGRYDFVTSADFDGDLDGSNNWENAPSYELPARVYYSVVETSTHYYITYALFHPRDWTYIAKRDLCAIHENDLEGAMFVVAKGTSTYGDLRLMGTISHGDLFLFKNVTNDVAVIGDPSHVDTADSLVHWSNINTASHPCLFVEAGGHRIGARDAAVEVNPDGHFIFDGTQTRYAFRGGDGVRYRCIGEEGVPTHEPPHEYPIEDWFYQLVPIETTLWAYRTGTDMFVQPFSYGGSECPITGLPRYFNAAGDPADLCARPPWAWYQGTGVEGQWFLDPADAYAAMLTYWADGSLPEYGHYFDNPYRSKESQLTVDLPAGGSYALGQPVGLHWTAQAGQNIHRTTATLYTSRSSAEVPTGRYWHDEGAIILTDGQATWTAAGDVSPVCQFAIRTGLICNGDYAVVGYSAPFAITEAPSISVIEPAGGESWALGSLQMIQWQPSGEFDGFDLSLSTDGGATYPYPVGHALGSASELQWHLPSGSIYLSDEARIRISGQIHGGGEIHNEGEIFSIVAPGADVVQLTLDPSQISVGQEVIVTALVTSQGVPLNNQDVTFSATPDGSGGWSGGNCGGMCRITGVDGKAVMSFYPSVSGDLILRGTAPSGASGQAILHVTEPTVNVSIHVHTTEYGSTSRYLATAKLEDHGSPMVGQEVTLTTTKGLFSNGTQTIKGDTGGSGEYNQTITVTFPPCGEVVICATPTNYPGSYTCKLYYWCWPPAPIAPYDTLNVDVAYNDEWDASSGMEWSPDGTKLVYGSGTSIAAISYPAKQSVFSTDLGDHIRDLSWDDIGAKVVVADENSDVITLDGSTGASLSRCTISGGDPNLSVDWTNTSTVVVGRMDISPCRLMDISKSNCSQSTCYSGLPATCCDVTRVRRYTDGSLAGVTSDVWDPCTNAGGAVLVYGPGGSSPSKSWLDQVSSGGAFYDCDWLPGGQKLVAGGEDFAAVYGLNPKTVMPLTVTDYVYGVAGLSSDSVAVVEQYDLRVYGTDGSPYGLWHSTVGALVDVAWNKAQNVLAVGGGGRVLLFNFSHDHEPPEVGVPQIVMVPYGQTTGTITGTVEDQTIHNLRLRARVESGSWVDVPITAGGSISYTTPVDEGRTHVNFEAVDYYRNSIAVSVSIVRPTDSTAPVVSDFNCTPGDGSPGTSYSFYARVLDLESGVNPSTVQLAILSSGEQPVTSIPMYDDGAQGGDQTAGDGIYSAEWPNSTLGYFYCRIIAADNAGNQMTSENLGGFATPCRVHIEATLALDRVTLRWVVPQDLSVLGFRIDRRTGDLDWASVAPNLPAAHGELTWVDPEAEAGRRYDYRVVTIQANGRSDISDMVSIDVPIPRLSLRMHPNPVVGECSVLFALPGASPVRIQAFDVAGREVATLTSGHYRAGTHVLSWSPCSADGRRLATGTYYLRLESLFGRRTIPWVVMH